MNEVFIRTGAHWVTSQPKTWDRSQKPGAKGLVLTLTNCVTLDEAITFASVFSPAICDVNVPWESNEPE